MKQTVGVIGSGIGGLAAAIRLAVKSYKVEIFEANAYPGGKLSEIRLGDYRFDAGPSLFTLPGLVDELFELAGETPSEWFNYSKLDVNCNYFYPDGTRIQAFADQDQFIKEIVSKTSEQAKNMERAIRQSAHLYDSLSELFMFSSLQNPKTFISKKAFKAYTRIPSLGFFKTMDRANRDRFTDPRVVQLFDRYATYNGSSPFKTPSTMNIIPHLEMSLGAFFPKGGMHAITLALYELAKRLGVAFHFSSPVRKIRIEEKRVKGIEVNNDFFPFDRVVSNMDIVNSYKKLMPEVKAPRLLLNQSKSSSALIFYWGIKKQFRELGLHNIFFTKDYRKEFDHIFERGTIYDDPTIYVNITSKMQPEDAPAYGENWFTMINVPNNKGQEWNEMIAKARKQIIAKLTGELGQDFETLIECEEILEPRTIESKTSSALGALYGNSSNNIFAAFLRHANRSKRIEGLYFCGGSVHPGGGIPMSLASAKLVAKSFR